MMTINMAKYNYAKHDLNPEYQVDIALKHF